MRGKEFDRFVKDDIKTWVPKDGVNILRILPPTWKDPEHYGFDIYVNYGVGADRQAYLDLDKMLGKPDPIAEERAKALRDGDEQYAKDLAPKRRCGVWIIDRDAEKEGVQFWAMPWTIDADIAKLTTDKRTGEVLNIDDPENGYDIEFEKVGKGRNTKYEAVAIARRSSPLGSKKWLEFALDNPIPDQLVYHDYEHIAKTFGGGGSHRGRDNEDDHDSDRSSDREERGGRDSGRDDRSRGRDRSRDDEERRDRGGDRGSTRGRGDDDPVREERGRDRGDSRGDDRDSGRSRDRDSDSGRGERRRRDEPAHSWDSIHDMTMEELESLCGSETALQDINPDKADGRTDLADWICEELKIKKEASTGRRRIQEEGKGDPESSDRLRRMREERDR
jgi:hypothetical protein